MKRLFFFICFIFFFCSYSQNNNPCGWEYTVTANNAVIAVQEDNLWDFILGYSDNDGVGDACDSGGKSRFI